MLKYLIPLAIIITTIQINSQDYKIIPDEKNSEPLILGYCPASIIIDSLLKIPGQLNTTTINLIIKLLIA